MLVSSIALELSPSLCWNHCPHCAGVAALVVLALLSLLRWCCHCPRCGLPGYPQLSTCQLNYGKVACKSTAQCKHIKGKEACAMRGLMPAHQGQQCQCDKGNETSQTHQLDGGNTAGATTVMRPMQHEGKVVSNKDNIAGAIRATTHVQCWHWRQCINSLTAIDGHDRQYFNELRSTVVSRRIFIRSQSLINH